MAYHDTDQENKGGQYRTNEGVDIWKTSDTGGGYHVNRTPNGEWLKYTVNMDPGRYDISVRMSTINSFGQQLRVLLDDVELALFDVPNTGDWQNWETVTAHNVTVYGGSSSILSLEVVNNGLPRTFCRAVCT